MRTRPSVPPTSSLTRCQLFANGKDLKDETTCVALQPGVLVIYSRGYKLRDLVPLHDCKASCKGAEAEISKQQTILAKLRLASEAEAQEWASAAQAAANSADESCVQALQAELRLQNRAAAWRSAVERVMQICQPRSAGHGTVSATAIHLDWILQKEAGASDAVSSPEATSKTATKEAGDAAAQLACLDEVPFFHRYSNSTQMCTLAVQGSSLVASPHGGVGGMTVMLSGASVSRFAKRISIWDHGLVARFWLSSSEEARHWLPVMREATKIGGSQGQQPKVQKLRWRQRAPLPQPRYAAECRFFCTQQSSMSNKQVSVALYDGALAVFKYGDLLEDVLDINGGVAAVQGLSVAVWIKTVSVARLWFPSPIDAQTWVKEFSSAASAGAALSASSASKSCPFKALKSELRAQQRSRCWRKVAGGAFGKLHKMQAKLCGEQMSATHIWQRWYEHVGFNNPDASLDKTQYNDEKHVGQLGTIPFTHETLGKQKVPCIVNTYSDILIAQPTGTQRCVAVTLSGTTITTAGSLVSVWTDSRLSARLWLESNAQAARWRALLEAAARLYELPSSAEEKKQEKVQEKRTDTELALAKEVEEVVQKSSLVMPSPPGQEPIRAASKGTGGSMRNRRYATEGNEKMVGA